MSVAAISNLTVKYGSKTAVEDLSVEVPEGCVGLLGPNGAGKTTLIKTLLGFIQPARGSGTVLGLNVATQGLRIRQLIGLMPEIKLSNLMPEIDLATVAPDKIAQLNQCLTDDSPILGMREVEQDAELTAMQWPVVPEALTELLLRVKRDYGDLPLLITENGAAFQDRLADGAVADSRRVAYLRAHIAAVERARAEGVDVRGYYVWSLLDNFEWEWGYAQRFGIVYVDYPIQRRIPKQIALWYRDMIARRNGG